MQSGGQARGARRHGARQLRSQRLVCLDGDHAGGGLQQRKGERAEAGADFEHSVGRVQAGQPSDPADGPGVGDEVLAQPLARPDDKAAGDPPDGGGPEQRGTGGVPAASGSTPGVGSGGAPGASSGISVTPATLS